MKNYCTKDSTCSATCMEDAVLASIPDFKAALKLCKEISGLSDKHICGELNIDAAQWSRIWVGQAHFPSEKITSLMDICGNWIPLRWLAIKYGQELKPAKTTLERENDKLRAELEKQRIEMEDLKKSFREVKAV